MSLQLPPRLCFGLVGVVLVGVLALGNPCRSCRKPDAPCSPAALQVVAPAAATAALAGDAAAARPAAPQAPSAVPEPCPLPEFAAAVRAVRHDAEGQPFWLLTDGRVIRHSAGAKLGEPDYVVLPRDGMAAPPGNGRVSAR